MTKVWIIRLLTRVLPPIAMMSTLPFVLSGCGGAHFSEVSSPTVSIAANPASIAAGSSATLSVSASNATSVTVSGTDGSSYTMPANGGSQTVTPAKTTTYTATAAGSGGSTSASTALTVTAATTPPPTVAIKAAPASITAGGSSTLTVTATNATAVTVTGTDGSSYTLAADGGNQAVSPAATTTYTATATGTGANATATAVVTVTAAAPPTVTIIANPASVVAGTPSTLTVTATNATGVTVTGTDGSSYTLAANGGSQAVTPMATATYTATATGAGGKATAAATVTVTQSAAPSVSIAANPATIASGSSSTLTVAAANATTVTVTGTDGSSYTLSASGGMQPVSPTVTTTYTATATGPGGKATAMAIVTVSPSPTVSIVANPATIGSGSSSTLTVAAANATTVTVTGTDGSSYTLSAAGGMQPVSPTATTTYTATATGPGGKATAMATVTVTAGPTVSIIAKPASITTGGSATLVVTAANATAVVVTGSDGSSYTLAAAGGMQPVSPTVTTIYTATATGTGGKSSAMATVTVTAPVPTVSIIANPASITSGSSSTLTVAATNATGVTVAGSDGSTYTLQPAGGAVPVNPTTTTTYTATATGAGGNATAMAIVTVTAAAGPTVSIIANPTTISSGSSSTLTVTATNATGVTVTGTDGSSYTLPVTGGPQVVSPTATTTTTVTYTATATGAGGSATATAVVTVNPAASVQSINHVIFMLQENHAFDNYFGMLNPYRHTQNMYKGDDGVDYEIDGIDDKLNKISNEDDSGDTYKLFKLASTCIDDDSSAWQSSYGDANRYDFSVDRPIKMDGYVHTAEGFATSCAASGNCSGAFTDLNGKRAMGYYDEGFLNYYYYMASQFAVSNRWFSPVASKSVDNRIATFTGGTTQGLVDDPGSNDHLPQLQIPTIFQKLEKAGITWRIYYTVTQGYCVPGDADCGNSPNDKYPATDFSDLSYSFNFLFENPTHTAAHCTGTTQMSSVVGDATNSFCIDPNHIAPLSTYYTDLTNGTLPQFAFIEAGYALNDEHPGSGQSVLAGQNEVSLIMNAFMTSSSWNDSVFFFAYDEGGGPYDHVPPVPGHSNQYTDATLGAIPVSSIPDISTIAVNADSYFPCVPVGGVATLHCDLQTNWPGAQPGDAPSKQGFAAQLGFRLPNFVLSPFTRRHYVSNIPMDHTAILKFVEDRFIGDHTYLTPRDAAQPNLLDFFDFNGVPWATPPTPPAPVTKLSLGYDPCTPASLGP